MPPLPSLTQKSPKRRHLMELTSNIQHSMSHQKLQNGWLFQPPGPMRILLPSLILFHGRCSLPFDPIKSVLNSMIFRDMNTAQWELNWKGDGSGNAFHVNRVSEYYAALQFATLGFGLGARQQSTVGPSPSAENCRLATRRSPRVVWDMLPYPVLQQPWLAKCIEN